MHISSKMSSRRAGRRQNNPQSAGVRPLNSANPAFTIVELLIVIVIIGILAAITIVSYSGITQKANTAALQSDLTNASKKLALYYTINNTYPTAIDQTTGCPTTPTPDTENCIKTKSGNKIEYYGNAKNFTLSISLPNNTSSSTITNDSAPKTLSLAAPTDCPTNYIPVPGSLTYGTSGFCVMKYEAKIAGNDNGNQTYNASQVPDSRSTGTPWVNISQTDAIAEAATACTGCHLITEAEWMTIAQNVLSVASNWSGGAVGSGYIFRGHSDNAPAASLAAATDDGDSYNSTGQTSGDQKRTLTLTNGQVIWDMAGNVWEWTSGQTSGNQPGTTTAGYRSTEWTNITVPGALAINVSPTGTGLTGANTWTQANGVGNIYSNTGEISLRGFLHGGDRNSSSGAGVLTLALSGAPGASGNNIGFRISRN